MEDPLVTALDQIKSRQLEDRQAVRLRKGVVHSVDAANPSLVTINVGSNFYTEGDLYSGTAQYPNMPTVGPVSTGDVVFWLQTKSGAGLVLGRVSEAVDDGGGEPTLSRIGVALTRGSAQSIPNNTVTTVTWTSEIEDFGGFFATGDTITVPGDMAGLYSIFAAVPWPGEVYTRMFTDLIVAGVTYRFNGGWMSDGSTEPHAHAVIPAIPLAGSDTIQLQVLQRSGAARNLTPRLYLYRLDSGGGDGGGGSGGSSSGPSLLTPALTASTTYTFQAADNAVLRTFTSNSVVVATLPNNTDVPMSIGTQIHGMQYGTGQVSVVGAAGVTVRARSSANKSAGQWARFVMEKINTNEWVISGDVVS